MAYVPTSVLVKIGASTDAIVKDLTRLRMDFHADLMKPVAGSVRACEYCRSGADYGDRNCVNCGAPLPVV